MRTYRRVLAAAACILIRVSAEAQQENEYTNYVAAQLGANSCVWQNVTPSFTNQQGRIIYRTNSYTELATGLNHWVNGQWAPSSENIQITQGGGLATNGQHQVGFAANINTSNAVEIVTPDGKDLRTHIMGLTYYDTASGSNVLFAQLQDSTGQVVANNQVVYPNAFTDCDADVRYTYTRAGCEQDIVVQKQLPTPDSYGLNPNTTWLQVWTEFFHPPVPAIEQILDGADERLDFGTMKMERGKAFIMGDETNSVPVNKAWTTVAGRTFLVEQIKFDSVADGLQSLPAYSGGGGASLQPFHFRGFPQQLPPPPKLAKRTGEKLKLAGTRAPEKGLVLDYTLNGSITNLTFHGDTTYYITGDVNLYLTTTIEGGTVVKFGNSGTYSINIHGPVNCQTSPYHMAVFTAVTDNTVGQTISGTGAPLNALSDQYTGGPITLQYLRISNATFGFNDSTSETNTIKHCQFVNDTFPAWLTGGGTDNLQNDLFNNVGDVVFGAGGTTINAVNLTVDNATALLYNPYPGSATLNLTNSLLVSVTTLGAYSGTNNFTTNSGGVFQTIGAGSHYLAAGSPYRDAGTTNIDPNLLNDLQSLTTYPPLWFTNTVTSDMTLYPQALRDYDTPDIGYHYPPIDYLTSCIVTNATLTLTNGVALTYYDGTGIGLQNNGQLVSQGGPLPSQRDHLVYYNLVQEQAIHVNGDSNELTDSMPITSTHTNLSQNPSINLRFTTICAPQGAPNMILADTANVGLNTFIMQDSEVDGGGGYLILFTVTNSVTLHNNAFKNVYWDCEVGHPLAVYNNLFTGNPTNVYPAAFLTYGLAPNTNKDNAYDAVDVYLDGSYGHNAYLNSCTLEQTTNSGDIVTNLTWVIGPLGNYYQATNSPLINAGSRSAALAGLYHYTVTTNEVPETTNVAVAIGYHYVALDANGQPLDANNDGIPDYLEDSNGDGAYGAGDLANWLGSSISDTNGIIALQVYTPLK